MPKRKIAILGGGLGSVSTAFWLTNRPNWQEDTEITLYQVGWRLGGKGAAGRGEDCRILEHGLHIWIGFYDNAFRMIQAVYKELDRPPTSPIHSWQTAFTPHNFIVIAEKWKDQWKDWPMDFPTNERVPGDAGEFLTIWDFLYEGLQLLVGHIIHHFGKHTQLAQGEHHLTWFSKIVDTVSQDIETFERNVIEDAFKVILELSRRHTAEHACGQTPDHSVLDVVLQHTMDWVEGVDKSHFDDDEIRRLYIVMSLGFAMARGILADIIGNEVKGWDEIDHLDFREWLKKYGASDFAVWSAPCQALYDLVFGYENGEVEKPNFGAGAALLSTLRIGMDYKGSIFWKMNAGMGDTIFAPIYEVLKKRGVKFEFFSRVENLGLSPDESYVQTITIGRQATTKGGEYDPFIQVHDIPCWPAEPLYDQLVEGEQLKREEINLESFWTPWKNVETKTLKLGEDFDQVVLGISIGSLPYICPELSKASENWRLMCENVQTVRTMSMQWWLKPDLKGLGWTQQSPVMDAYVEPMNTWGDMSFLLDMECWPETLDEPQNLAYFCGAMVGGIPDPDDHGFPQRALDEVTAVGMQFANNDVGFLWPKATRPDNPNGLDFSLLRGQYYRANVDPSERYVLSLKGSVDYRIKTDKSGFLNLFLTGDWIYNYFNAGCVEATVVSGMLCSHAITGMPKIADIEGVRPGKWWEIFN